MMKTLDEYIQYCEEVAEEKERQVKECAWEKDSNTERRCIECAKEHRQLAEWLRKLQAYEEAREEIIRKRDSGQWSETVVFGFNRAIRIIDKHLKEVNADGDTC